MDQPAVKYTPLARHHTPEPSPTASGTLFIPDISGFTHFITHTEIQHSQYIIAELLELIVNQTGDDFDISEIEGDAILFYRLGEAYGVIGMLARCKKIFIAFHQHLRSFERDRICQCGACASASKLSLKFILHYGVLAHVQIKTRQKLIGKAVIVAHRLLKNSIRQTEYVLFSEAYVQATGGIWHGRQMTRALSSYDVYDFLGKISFDYYLPRG